jgi:UDP-N-acetylglucosamine diphosphorylase/glucosamine-1-phosphate N-acetyltransferase
MIDSICIFEGIYYERLLPIVYFRPTYDLRCGILSLREKIARNYEDIPISLHSRAYLAEYVRQRNPEFKVNELEGQNCLFINGRVIADKDFGKKIPPSGSDKLYVNGDTIIAARVSGQKLQQLKKAMNDLLTVSDFSGLVKEEVDVEVVNFPWDLIKFNSQELVEDYEILTSGRNKPEDVKIHEGSYLIEKDRIFIDSGSVIHPTAVLDASDGPVYIGKNVMILPHATIQGPAYIGDNSTIKIGAKLYHNTNIGRVCKVGGEIEDSVIHSYSNKQHDGFLGHSYLGSWVNLGADTNNSDLKNNYGSIKVYVGNELVDTGLQFVGLCMGDHSKTAINTAFNTGTVVGVCCNIFGAGFPSRNMPSFTWGGAESLTTYDLEKSIDVAKRVEARRDVEMTKVAENLFRKVFDLTKEDRRRLGLPN